MAVALPYGGMNQDEQQPIHPFFRKDVKASDKTSSQRLTLPAPLLDAKDNGPSHNDAPSLSSPSGAVKPNGVAEHVPTSAHESSQALRSSFDMDNDPNYDRRKRRKTSSPEADVPLTNVGQSLTAQPSTPRCAPWSRQLEEAALAQPLKSGEDNNGGPQTPTQERLPVKSAPHTTPPAEERSAPSSKGARSKRKTIATQDGQEPSPLHPTGPNSAGHASALTKQVDEAVTPKQKLLKLNPNGKLLSSPTGGSPPRNVKGRTGRSRGKTDNGITQITKVVRMSYGVDSPTRIAIGTKVEAILQGSQRQDHPRLVLSPPKPIGPPKPTHPFFLGKARQKGENSARMEADLLVGPNGSEVDSECDASGSPQRRAFPSNTTSRRGGGALPSATFGSSWKPLFPKVLDSFAPIWPPKGFQHIRGEDEQRPSTNQLNKSFSIYETKTVKDKAAATAVSVDEDILSRLYVQLQPHGDAANAEQSITSDVLRTPNRRLLSGSILQGLTREKFKSQGLSDASNGSFQHPAIARMLQSLPNSLSAFDQAKCENLSWTTKYLPMRSEDVLQVGREPVILRDWLRSLVISAVDTGLSPFRGSQSKTKGDASKQKKKKRRRHDDLDDFIISSDEEAYEMNFIEDSADELAPDFDSQQKRTVMKGNLEGIQVANAVLISGPFGCGKTASVFAVARELGFEIFEINSSSRRNAKDILDKVGDMTQNHLVQQRKDAEEQNTSTNKTSESLSVEKETQLGKQPTVKGFFKSKPSHGAKPKPTSNPKQGSDSMEKLKPQQSQKQSLILVEEVDILFEEDKQFWNGLLSLMSQSRRPIVLTCNDESLVPLDSLNLHAILRYSPPPTSIVTNYLTAIAANEGHSLDSEAISSLYRYKGHDLRAAIMELNFWCQMGVGDQKGGLDWMLNRPLSGTKRDPYEEPLRVVSEGTYVDDMGRTARDISHEPWQNDLVRWSEVVYQTIVTWNLSPTEWLEDEIDPTSGSIQMDGEVPAAENTIHELHAQELITEAQSVIDLLSRGFDSDASSVTLDPTVPEMSEKMRLNRNEGYPVLEAEPSIDFTNLAEKISCTASVLAMSFASGERASFEDEVVFQRVKQKENIRRSEQKFTRNDLLAVFEPIMAEKPTFPPSTGRLALSFDDSSSVLVEDLAPYIRCIVAFDQRLEQQRLELSNILVHGSRTGMKTRTTRASRAALEGGDKASTRRERWFPNATNFARVLGTGGGQSWQEAALKRVIMADPGDVDDHNETKDDIEDEETETSSTAFPGSSASSIL